MRRPSIQTAIPVRRYQLGAFLLTFLDEISSADDVQYRFLLAVTREGESQPGMYITSEKDGSQCLTRLIMRDGSEELGSAERWCSLDDFVDDAIGIVVAALNLGDETPHRLL